VNTCENDQGVIKISRPVSHMRRFFSKMVHQGVYLFKALHMILIEAGIENQATIRAFHVMYEKYEAQEVKVTGNAVLRVPSQWESLDGRRLLRELPINVMLLCLNIS
jgi:hypothetical protein